MQDTMIRVYLAAGAAKERVRASLEDQRGQATAEYVGVILLLVTVIAFLATNTNFGSAIATSIKDVVTAAIDKIGQAIN